MNKRLKTWLVGALLSWVMMWMLPFQWITSYASNATTSFSDPSVSVGNQVSVNMKVAVTSGDPVESYEFVLSYNPSVLEFLEGTDANGGAGTIRIVGSGEGSGASTLNFSLKFKALQPENTKITIASQELYDVNNELIVLDRLGTSTVKVTSLSTTSKDANLKELKISPGTLTPVFSKEVSSYQVSVGLDVKKVILSAVASDAGANVVVSGNDDLKEGENTVVCRVTAADGKTVKEYKILVTKQEGGEGSLPVSGNEIAPVKSGQTVTILSDTFTLASEFDGSLLPSGYQAGSILFNEEEVMVGKRSGESSVLLYLLNEKEEGQLYLYDPSSNEWSAFISIGVADKTYQFVPYDYQVSIPEGFVEQELIIDGQKVIGWVWQEEEIPVFCLFYGVNEDGEKDLYRYDLEQHTIQRYFRDPAVSKMVSVEEYEAVQSKYASLKTSSMVRNIMILILVVALAIVVYLLLQGKKQNGKRKPRIPLKQEPDLAVKRQKRLKEPVIEELEDEDFEESFSLEELEEEEDDDFESFDL